MVKLDEENQISLQSKTDAESLLQKSIEIQQENEEIKTELKQKSQLLEQSMNEVMEMWREKLLLDEQRLTLPNFKTADDVADRLDQTRAQFSEQLLEKIHMCLESEPEYRAACMCSYNPAEVLAVSKEGIDQQFYQNNQIYKLF